LEQEIAINHLYSSVAFQFMNDYNQAISKVVNRDKTLAGSEVFDFN